MLKKRVHVRCRCRLTAVLEIRLLRANKLLVPVTTRRGRVSRRVYLEKERERRVSDATRRARARFIASSRTCASVNQRAGRHG